MVYMRLLSKNSRKRNRQKGFALITTFGSIVVLSIAVTSYIDSSNTSVRIAQRRTYEIQCTQLALAGVEKIQLETWKPFKVDQDFVELDRAYNGASRAVPRGAVGCPIEEEDPSEILPMTVGNYAAAVINYERAPFHRIITIESIGWLDLNGDGVRSVSEPKKVITSRIRYNLARARIFDYAWFVNNSGWMMGNRDRSVIINGDMGANGDITNGEEDEVYYVNGSLRAVNNDKLMPTPRGLVNNVTAKMTDGDYQNELDTLSADITKRMRPAYNPAVHGAVGSAEFEKWRDLVYTEEAINANGRYSGPTKTDINGVDKFWRRDPADKARFENISTEAPDEIAMPDLSDISVYEHMSHTWHEPRAHWRDGSRNNRFGSGASLEVWDAVRERYRALDAAGVVHGSVIALGDEDHPIKINGPITIKGDLVIKGNIEGQGTFYTERNVHVVGDIKYTDPTDWRTTGMRPTMRDLDYYNEKKSMVAFCAAGSVVVGNPRAMQEGILQAYFEAGCAPPITRQRKDEHGVILPAWDGFAIDAYGVKGIESVIDQNDIDAIHNGEAVKWMDGYFYSNWGITGELGEGADPVVINGGFACREEVLGPVNTGGLIVNYDIRLRERAIEPPLVDIMLPRAPEMKRFVYQETGFIYNPDAGEAGNMGHGF